MKCHFCKLNHFIYKCEGFQAPSLDKKRKFVLSNNMCLSCFMVGHFTKDCKRKVTCNICKQIHPTPLHEELSKTKGAETTKEEKASALYCKRTNNSNHTSMIIPVWLSCVKAESPEILVYALLYTQSSNTFCISRFRTYQVEVINNNQQKFNSPFSTCIRSESERVLLTRRNRTTSSIYSRIHPSGKEQYPYL